MHGGTLTRNKDDNRNAAYFFCNGMSDPWLRKYVTSISCMSWDRANFFNYGCQVVSKIHHCTYLGILTLAHINPPSFLSAGRSLTNYLFLSDCRPVNLMYTGYPLKLGP